MLKTNQTKNLFVASQSRELYTTKRLLEEGQKLGLQVKYLNPFDLPLFINFSKRTKTKINTIENTLYLHRTTGVNFDDFDIVVSKHYESLGCTVSNPINAVRLMRNKDEQALFMANQLIPSIPTFVFRGKPTSEIIKEISESLHTTTFVLKMSRGNKGVGVNYVNGLVSLQSLLETFHAMKDQKMLIQPFIKHEKEWRFFIIKNEIIAVVEKKIDADDFRGNAKRAKSKIIKKPNFELSKLALDAFKKSGLDYAGIDIIESTKGNQNFICEINAIAGFEQIETISKINIAKEIITHI